MKERFNENSTRKFTLEIELGNDAMRNSVALSDALREVSNRVLNTGYTFCEPIIRGILDSNGNTVGFWKIDIDE